MPFYYCSVKCVLCSALIPSQSATSAVATTVSFSRSYCSPFLEQHNYKCRYFEVGLYFIGIDVYSNKQAFKSSTWFVYRCNYVHCVYTMSTCNVLKAMDYCLNAHVQISFLFIMLNKC